MHILIFCTLPFLLLCDGFSLLRRPGPESTASVQPTWNLAHGTYKDTVKISGAAVDRCGLAVRRYSCRPL